jgi:hypothetical protein
MQENSINAHLITKMQIIQKNSMNAGKNTEKFIKSRLIQKNSKKISKFKIDSSSDFMFSAFFTQKNVRH